MHVTDYELNAWPLSMHSWAPCVVGNSKIMPDVAQKASLCVPVESDAVRD